MNGETKTCPRCGNTFSCLHQNIAMCPCTEVPLTAEQLRYLGERYKDCLCVECLRHVQGTYGKQARTLLHCDRH